MDNSNKAIAKRLTDLDEEFHALLRDAPWKHTYQPTRPHHQPQDKDQNSPRQVAVILPSPQHTGSATGTQKQPFPWWRLAEGFGILAAVIVAAVNIGQWQDLRQNFMVQQRAWVGPEKADFGIKDDRFQWVIYYKDFGPSPAQSVWAHSRFAVIHNGAHIEDEAVRKMIEKDISQIAPLVSEPKGITYPQVTVSSVGASNPTLSSGLGQLLASKMSSAVVYGAIGYKDIFGVSHRTEFCYFDDLRLPKPVPGPMGCPYGVTAN